MAAAEKEKFLKIEREIYESKTKEERFRYFIRGKLRGKEIKANLIPSDINGYNLLDVVFEGFESADLVITPFEMKNETTGEIIKGNTYSARTIDENGEIFECPVKPRQKSDKSIIDMLLLRL